MLKSSEEALSKIPILRYDGRQTLDFTAWKKSFATSMGQRYGVLAQVYRTGEDYEYVKPPDLAASVLSADTSVGILERAMYLEQMSEYRKAKMHQVNTNIQLYSELFNKLHEDTCKKLIDDPLWAEIERKQDPKGLMTAVTKIMLLASSGNSHQDTHRARMVHHALRQQEKESLHDYYTRTARSLATQLSLGHKLDPEIDQAMDFTYKLDRKLFQPMITNMDWLEESELRKFQVALKTDAATVHATTYPTSIAEAYQRANSYQLGHSRVTTGTVADNHQTIFASETKSDPSNKKDKDKRKAIPHAEWIKMTPEQQDVIKAQNRSTKKCEFCNKTGHTESQCRSLKNAISELKKDNSKKIVAHTTSAPASEEVDEEDAYEAVYVHTTETVLHYQYNPLCEDLVLCDHCASAAIFRNKNLLTNIRHTSSTITFTGIGGSIEVSQQGDFGVFGTVAYDERATFNVLSVDSLPESSIVTYNHAERCHTISIQDKTYAFKVPHGKKGLPVRRFPHVSRSDSHVLANTVAQNESMYTKREVEEAKQARDLYRMLAYPSFKDMSEAISSGTLIDCPVTIQSLRRSTDIYGTPDGILKGKTTHTTSTLDKVITVIRPAGNDVHLNGDIFFIEGLAFFLTFGTPVNLLCVTALANRTVTTISKALDQHIANYRGHGFQVTEVFLDSESGLVALSEIYQLRGVKLTYAPPGQHVPVIERKIRLVKIRCRALFSNLPCALCKQLLIALVKFAISRINLLPVLGSRATAHSWHRLSPREMLTGTKTSFTRDLRIGFLDYAQLTEPVNETTYNSLKPRTRGGVALYSLGNSKGSVIFMTLDTGTEVAREKFHLLPMPDVVISHLNALAAKDKKTFSNTPDFLYHGLVIPDDPTSYDTADTYFSPLPTEAPPITEETSSYPAEDHDSSNRGGEFAEQEEFPEPTPLTETQQLDEIGGESLATGEIGGVPTTKMNDENIEEVKDTRVKEVKPITKPKEKFTRESYMLRERKPTSTALVTLGNDHTQHSYNLSIKGAIKSHGDIAVKALFTECSSLLGKSTFHPVSKKTLTEEEMRSVIRSSCFMKEKMTPEGTIEKVKARLVAGGDQQDKSIHTLNETSSPTVSTAAVLVTMAIAAHERRHVMTMDVETAYLNARMIDDKPVFMRIGPLVTAILGQLDAKFEKYLDSKGSVIVKLDKALYGCVESAVLWYKDLRATLEEDGYIVNPYDLCVFNKYYEGKQITVIFHVDDLLAACAIRAALEKLYATLVRKYEKVKVKWGEKHPYLGMIANFQQTGVVTIGNPGFVMDILKEYGETRLSTTPAGENLFNVRESPPLSTPEAKRFHSFVAKLLYLSKRTRPDILTLVAFLTTRVHAPTEDDRSKLHKGMGYLAGTIDLCLTLEVKGPIKVTAFVDASFATHNSDMRSHTGVYITLGKGAIYCRSSKQKLVTKSSTEAELVGISDALPQIIWLKHFLEAQGHPALPAHIWKDNQSTICLAKTGRSCSERSRHIEIRFF